MQGTAPAVATDTPRAAIEASIPDRFRAQVRAQPDRIAVEDGDRLLTYGQLDAVVNTAAGALRRVAPLEGERVVLLMDQGAGAIAATLAILKCGAAYVPLDPRLPAELTRAMIASAEPALIVAARAHLAAAVGLLADPARTLCWEEIEAAPAAPDPGVPVAPGALAYLYYTSGSTGAPKGVADSHRNVLHNVWRYTTHLGITRDDRLTLLQAPHFSGAVSSLFAALLNGGCSLPYDVRRHGLAPLGPWLRARRATMFHGVPAIFREAMDGGGFPALRCVRLEGDRATARDVEIFRRACAPGTVLANGLGATECGLVRQWRITPATPVPEGPVPIGAAIADMDVVLLDDAHAPTPPGETGQIAVRSRFLALGYWRQPELTAKRFLTDARDPAVRTYLTGDLGRMLPDGTLQYLGRADFQAKVRGQWVDTDMVERTLRAAPGVADAAVAIRADAAGEPRLAAYVVPGADGAPAPGAWRAHVAAHLPAAMVPTAWVTLEKLPLDRNLKVDRKALPEPAAPAKAGARTAPRDEPERRLAAIWADVLKTDAVGVDDDFFALGGDSLQAMELAARVAQALGVELPPEAIFEHATVARLARHLAASPRGETARAPRRAGPPPPSFAQQRLWFLDRFEGASVEYHLAQAVRLRGPLDRAALARAITAIVARHGSLRMRFPAAQGVAVQEIAAAAPCALAFAEAVGGGEAEAQATLRRWRDEPFDLERGPLFRAALLRLGEADHVLLCTWHHIVADGWSVGVFNRELAALYAAAIEGRADPLPPPAVQYADWAAAQRERLGGAALAALVAHWRERLRDLPALGLPLDFARPVRQEFAGARHDFAVPASAAARLRAIAAEENATPFMALLAVFQVLLARTCGQDDVAVGTPIANRGEPALHGAIGLFTGLLVLRGDLAGRPTFREALGRARRTALEAYAHQALPFEKLVEELNPPRDLGRHPLFQVLLALQNADATPLRLAGTAAEPWPLTTDSTHFDLELHLTPAGDTWTASLVFSTALFLPATIARMAGHFLTLLDSLLAEPDRAVADAALLTPAERHDLLVTWNATAAPEPADPVLHRLVAAQARRTPGAIALEDARETLTHAQVEARAGRLAARLRALGVGPEVRVGVCLARTVALPVALLAVLKAGGAYVPLDPQFPPARLALILEDAAAPVIVAERAFAGLLGGYAGKILWADEPSPEAVAPADATGPGHAAYVLYTSGSTGRPKGVVIEHRAVVNALRSFQREPGLAAGDVLVAGTTASFDISVVEFFLPLLCGARAVVAPDEARTDGRALAALLERSGATMFQATPATWKLLLQSGWPGRPTLRAWVGGEALPAALVRALLPRVRELWNLYGPTETTIYSLLARVESAERIVIGRPIANTQAHLVDAQLQPVPVGVAGELLIGGAGLARGYWQREALTAEKFLPDPFAAAPGARLYRTGDRCRRLLGGEIEFLGRIDAQVKLRGFRIELGEVEAALRQLAGVRDAAAAVQEDAAGERHLVACIVPAAADGAPAPAALREALRRTLPDYMVPAQFVSAPALPLTPNGKVNRAALPRPRPAPPMGPAADAAPRTLLELRLLEAWRGIFRNDAIGRDDDFFALGGHSLLAAELAVAIEAAAGRRVPIAALFRAPTVATLAELLAREGGAPAGSALVPLRPAGAAAPLFCVHGWGGEVFGFVDLARELAPGRPVYGLRAERAASGALRHATVERMAAHYAAEIRALAPRGPYHLAGHSAGGWIALAVAQALHRAGAPVATLALLDTEPVFPLPAHLRLRLLPAFLARRLQLHLQAWRGVPAGGRGRFLRDKARALLRHVRFGGFAPMPAQDPVVALVADYRPQKYPGDVTLFTVAQSRGTLVAFWRWQARGRVRVRRVAGTHHSLLVRENAAGLARALERELEENERDAGP